MKRTMIVPYPLLAERLDDRQLGHKAVMAALPRNLGKTPRAVANCLWRHHDGVLHVQADCDVRADILGGLVSIEEVAPASESDVIRVDVEFNVQKTPPSDVPPELRTILKQEGGSYRSRQVIVPEEERQAWCLKRFLRKGFLIDDAKLELSPVRTAHLGRRGGQIPYVRVSAVGQVVDAASWNKAVQNGLGRGRNFGLGLALTTPISERQPA